MKQKPFWRRVNRGFVVSMALLAAVLLYVLITQLLLLPQREQLAGLAGKAMDAVMNTEYLLEAELPADQRKAAYVGGVGKELEPLFDTESEYGTEAAGKAAEAMYDRLETEQRIDSQQQLTEKVVFCTIEEDVASIKLRRGYQLDGWLYVGEMRDMSGATQQIEITLTCKKTGDGWKIYRVSSVSPMGIQAALKGGN